MSEIAEQTLAIPLPDRDVGEGYAVREAAVSSSAAREHPFACPRCGSDSVLVEGQYRREFAEEFKNGKSEGHDLAPELEKNILAINCARCKVRYVIEPDEMFTLREEVMNLEIELAQKDFLKVIDLSNQKVN